MTKIAEAYVHLRKIEVTQDSLIEIGNFASAIATDAGRPKFPPDATVEVLFREGSLRGWVTVGVPVLLATYGAIANYSGFKQSIREMYQDSQEFGDYVIKNIIRQPNVAGARLYRAERRTKTLGRIKRLIDRREWLDAHSWQLSRKEVDAEEARLRGLLEGILADVEPAERGTLRHLLGESDSPIPTPDPARIAVVSRRDEQLAILGLEADAADDRRMTYRLRFMLSDGPQTATRYPV